MAAIILACSAFEGFLNETAQLAETLLREPNLEHEYPRDPYPEHTLLVAINGALGTKAARKATAETRHDLAWKAITGTPIDPQSKPRAALAILRKLRNDIVHSKSYETELRMHNDPEEAALFHGEWLGRVVEHHWHPEYLSVLEQLDILNEGGHEQPWVHRVCSRRVADWACDTVEELAEALIARTPASTYRERMEGQSLAGSKARAAARKTR